MLYDVGMKHFLSFALATALTACTFTQLPPQAEKINHKPVVAPSVLVRPSAFQTISRGDWAITLLPGFSIDETKEQSGTTTTILTAKSKFSVGRGPMMLVVNSTPFIGPPELFAMLSDQMIEESTKEAGGQVLKSAATHVSGNVGALIATLTKFGVGIMVLAVSDSGTGYIVSCGGDVTDGNGDKISRACIEMMKSFSLKKHEKQK